MNMKIEIGGQFYPFTLIFFVLLTVESVMGDSLVSNRVKSIGLLKMSSKAFGQEMSIRECREVVDYVIGNSNDIHKLHDTLLGMGSNSSR
jgi:hypothetical protein